MAASHYLGHWHESGLRDQWDLGPIPVLSLTDFESIDFSSLSNHFLICEIRILMHVAWDLCELCWDKVYEALVTWHVGRIQ